MTLGRRRWAVLLAIPPLLAAAWLWHPLVGNYFFDDDFPNLFLICNAPLLQYLLTPQVGHVYLVRNAVFYVFARLFGTDAGAYFTVVWLTHVLNVGLLYWAVERFTASAAIACVCALLFATCPAVEGALGWYSVFGHAMTATALLLILVDAAGLSARGRAPGRARQCVWAVLALGSTTTFGVGVGIAVVLPFALALLLPAAAHRSRLPPLWPVILLVPVLYVGLFWLYARIGPPEQVAAVHALGGILATGAVKIPRLALELIAYAIDRLLAGPLPLPPYPAVAGAAVAGGAAMVGLWAMLRGPRSARRLLLAAALLTLACYGTIAGGRFFLVDMFGSAEVVAQTRYHYVGLVTLALALAAVLVALAEAFPEVARLRTPLLAGWLAVWLFALWLRPPPIDHHDAARTEVTFLIAWMRNRAHQVPEGEDVYLANRLVQAASPLFFSRREFPGRAGLFSIYFPDPTIDGRRVVFVEADADTRAALRNARRLAGALVAPEDVPLLPDTMTPIDLVCPLPAMQNGLEQSP
jgi:hypothetical protein